MKDTMKHTIEVKLVEFSKNFHGESAKELDGKNVYSLEVSINNYFLNHFNEGAFLFHGFLEMDGYRKFSEDIAFYSAPKENPIFEVLDNGKVKINDDFKLFIYKSNMIEKDFDGKDVEESEFDLSKFLECFEGDVVGIDSPSNK